MIKLNNIREFIDLVNHCQFCDNNLNLTIQHESVPTGARYVMDFNDTTFESKLGASIRTFDRSFKGSSITYYSEFNDPKLSFSYMLNNKSYEIFSVNVDTNEVNGDLDKIQKVIWDFKLLLERTCIQNKDKRYLIKTTPLVLERRSKKICPMFVHSEICRIEQDEKEYVIVTDYARMQSHIAMGIELIKTIPVIPLYKIKDGDKMFNKIKTLITFS